MSVDGLLVIDKPAGPTSHDVVTRARRVLGESRVGHTGTLDPAATGVLPLVAGRATRLARFLSATDKRYHGVIRLGVATDTYDAGGAPSGVRYTGPWPSRETIERALDVFRGTFPQQPPSFSARRIDGQRSYTLARAKTPRTLPAAVVTVFDLELVLADGQDLTLRVHCSAGFYVRSLAHDLGIRLGTGAHLAALRRTWSGDFSLADALSLDAAERDPAAARAALIPPARMLRGLASVMLTDEGARRVAHGRDIGPDEVTAGLPAEAGRVCLLDPHGTLLAVAEPARTPGLLHPSVVLM
jgi:tRNA pseudouridine55 synthase